MPNNKWVADLKTVLQVAKARLDVREKKKTEQVAKERYTVADYVRNNKIPRARIGKKRPCERFPHRFVCFFSSR